VISQASGYDTPATASAPPATISLSHWSAGLTALLKAVRVPGMRRVYLGNTPDLTQDGTTCLDLNLNDVQACSRPTQSAVSMFNPVEQATVAAAGVDYVDTIPWFCSTRCTAVIGKYCVYWDASHITAPWAVYLQNLLADSIGIPGQSAEETIRAPISS